MPEFTYVARDLTGQRKSGKLSAQSVHEVSSTLAQKALFPIQIEAEKAASRGLWPARRVKGQIMANAYSQLADLLRSGVPLMKALDVVHRQSSNALLTEALADLKSQVEDGTPLADAMARHPRVFSNMAVSMARAGAEGAFLEESLDHVARFTEMQEDIKSRTIGALAYPVFLSVVGTLVVSGLIIFVVPKFDALFTRLRDRGELPIFTDWLLGFSGFLGTWWYLVLIFAIVIGLFVSMRLKTDEGQLVKDRLKLKVPMAGPIFLNMAVGRFCRVLGTLLKSGVPILRGLEISMDACGNRVLSAVIDEARENISHGDALAGPLARSGHFPKSVVEMIAVAEESNTLDKVLVDVADGLERRTWRQLDLFVRLLEPVMLLILASVVLVVVIALLLPVIKMSTTI
jgi:general secretion pathway protein F/type IV pilus assembly protein PilC